MKKFYTIATVIILITIGVFLLKGKIIHKKLDSYVWKTANLNKEENWSLRWDMINALRNRYRLVGMTKKEIVELLGKTDSITKSEFRYCR